MRQKTKHEMAELMGAVASEKITAAIRELQASEDITRWQETSRTYRGNTYTTYKGAVKEISRKYSGVANWGCVITGSVIDVRAAFTIPQGLDLIAKKGGEVELEMAFAEEFLEYNQLDKHMPLEFSKESEIEGKLLVVLIPDENHEWEAKLSNGKTKKMKGMIKVRFYPWTTYNYTIVTAANDYLEYEKVEYTDLAGKPKNIKAPNFTYRMFGGRINNPNNPAMKIWKCLTQIDSLSQALRDWREINNMFSRPILGLKVDSQDDVEEAQAQLDNMNLKLRLALAYCGELGYTSPTMTGVESLNKELIALAKMISGTTGVPVHFLGLPDLMSNRSTAENLMELVYASTLKEREIWESAYNEMLFKAIDIFNEMRNGKTLLKQNLVDVVITQVTKEQWQYLEKVYLPLYEADAITLDYLLLQIPGLNIEEEKKRREDEEKTEMKKLKTEMKDREKDGLENPDEVPFKGKGNDDGNLQQPKRPPA